MSGVNKVILVGRLGQDPEVRYLPNGDAVANISVATSEEWKDKQTGEKQEKTEWHRCVLWRKLGELAAEYLQKGSQVYLEGSLQTRKWQDNDGNDRYTTEVNVRSMQFLGGGKQNQDNGGQQRQQQAPTQSAPPPTDDFDDDVPF